MSSSSGGTKVQFRSARINAAVTTQRASGSLWVRRTALPQHAVLVSITREFAGVTETVRTCHQTALQILLSGPGDTDDWNALGYGQCLRLRRDRQPNIQTFDEPRHADGETFGDLGWRHRLFDREKLWRCRLALARSSPR